MNTLNQADTVLKEMIMIRKEGGLECDSEREKHCSFFLLSKGKMPIDKWRKISKKDNVDKGKEYLKMEMSENY